MYVSVEILFRNPLGENFGYEDVLSIYGILHMGLCHLVNETCADHFFPQYPMGLQVTTTQLLLQNPQK